MHILYREGDRVAILGRAPFGSAWIITVYKSYPKNWMAIVSKFRNGGHGNNDRRYDIPMGKLELISRKQFGRST